MNWSLAACQRSDPRLFFPPDKPGRPFDEDKNRREAARMICSTCPILSDCRQWALENPLLAGDGIWGGLTRDQRKRERARRREQASRRGVA